MRRFIRSAAPPCALVAFLACGGQQTSSGRFEPQYGFWTYTEKNIVANSCGSDGQDGIDLDGPLSISGDGDGFTVVPGYGPMFDCSLRGQAFECEGRPAEHLAEPSELAEVPGVTSGVEVIASGEFSSPTLATGRQKATRTCDGPGCAALAGRLPCTIEVAWTASIIE